MVPPPLEKHLLYKSQRRQSMEPLFFSLCVRVGRGGIWETKDVYGDRQAEAAAKSVQRQRPTAGKTTPTKTGSSLNILRRSSKEKTYVVSQLFSVLPPFVPSDRSERPSHHRPIKQRRVGMRRTGFSLIRAASMLRAAITRVFAGRAAGVLFARSRSLELGNGAKRSRCVGRSTHHVPSLPGAKPNLIRYAGPFFFPPGAPWPCWLFIDIAKPT